MDRRSAGGESRRAAALDGGGSVGGRRRLATFSKRILRVGAFAGAIVGGSLALTASCTSSTPGGPPQSTSTDAADHAEAAGQPDATSTTDAPVADADAGSGQCPALPDPSRCNGGDPGIVFAPPLDCDPAVHDASAPIDPDAGVDPCALVTTLTVFPTPAACRAFIAAEASGNLGDPTSRAAPNFSEPSDGAMLTRDEWSIFVWSRVAVDARRGPVDQALELLEPSAHAAPPLDGDLYVLEFSQGCTEVLRVIQTSTYWQPDPVSWNILSALTGPVRVQVFWLSLSRDSLVSPPLPSVPITITMQNTGD